MNAPDLKPCGTVAAWWRHYRRDEDPCESCKTAMRASLAAKAREYRRSSATRQCTACPRTYPAAKGARGWCPACFMRWSRAGKPESGPPPARRKKVAEPRTPKLKPLTKWQAKREDYAWLRQCGVERQEAAERVGISPETGRQWDAV